jgi:hypothetical protein
VGAYHHEHAVSGLDPVHLVQQRCQDTLLHGVALGAAVAGARVPLGHERIDLVEEEDCGSVGAPAAEQLAHCTHRNKACVREEGEIEFEYT